MSFLAWPRHVLRLLTIYRVMMRHGLYELVLATHLLGPARFAVLLWPGTWFRKERPPLGERLRLTLEDLGPVFVKFGQALSTRPDILPPDIARELSKLQDKVPPFPGPQARDILETALGRPVARVFDRFEVEPMASASVAQVHEARLKDGRDVVVKVLRPDIEKVIARDVDVLKALASLAQRYWPDGRRLRPTEVVDEYEKTIFDELDLMREAANAAQLRRNFADKPILYIPEVHWDYCRRNVMVPERIYGEPVANVPALKTKGVDMAVLADRGVEIFFTQVFKHNFFHADMHPGNIFVDTTDPADPGYVAVDFGIVGTLTVRDQHYLAANLLAFFKRDYNRVAELHVESGWVPAGTRVDEFESAIRTVCEPVFNKPLKDISFGHFLVRLFQVARRFDMEVQPQLVLLQKTLLNIEGLGRQLYPELDLWSTAQPFLEEWIADQASGREVLNKLRDNLPDVGESLQSLPLTLMNSLQNLAEGKVRLELDVPEPGRRGAQGGASYAVLAGGSALIAGALLIGLDANPAWLGWTVGAAGLALLYAGRPGHP